MEKRENISEEEAFLKGMWSEASKMSKMKDKRRLFHTVTAECHQNGQEQYK